MRIIIPVLGFGKSGGNRVLSNLADELVSLGHEVFFLSPDTSDVPYFPSTARVIWIDKKGRQSFVKSSSPGKSNFFTSFYRFTKAFKKLPLGSYDVILANHSLTTLPVKAAGLAHKTIYYVQAYEPEYYEILPGLKNSFLKILSAYSYTLNLFTIVNADVYRQYKKLTSNRVLYPGIDARYFFPAEEKSPTDKIIIGTIGRIERFKGTQYVLDAFISIRKQYRNAELHVAFGNEKDFEGINGVYCVMPHGDKALGEYYRSLNYYFCAGNVQLGAFHYPVAEALSCGVSVITTSYYPANKSNAWIIEPDNAGQLVESFSSAFNNDPERNNKIQQGLEDMKNFGWKKVGERMNLFLAEFERSNS